MNARERERVCKVVNGEQVPVASSELRDMYGVYNREMSKIGFQTQVIMLAIQQLSTRAQSLHSIVASSEICNREVRNLGFKPKS